MQVHLGGTVRESLLVKSADVISNSTELIDDYNRNGEQNFARFNAPKEKMLGHTSEVVATILELSPESPRASDLRMIETEVLRMNQATVTAPFPARIISYEQYDENTVIECGSCHWKGKCQEGVEHHDDVADVTCPVCGTMLLVVSH